MRQPDDVLDNFKHAATRYPDTRRIFLADGDAMILPYKLLHQYLTELNKLFPRLARVNVYANGSSIIRKTQDELKSLYKLKLNTLYVGLETGSQKIIDIANKKETVDNMVQGVITAQQCGLRCSVMILLGLGGKKYTVEHAEYTAAALNIMQPRLLSALRFIEIPGTDMYDKEETLSEYGAVLELRSIINGLELSRTVFRANHTSNPIPLSGRFPQDKHRLLSELDYLLANGKLDKKSPGKMPLSL